MAAKPLSMTSKLTLEDLTEWVMDAIGDEEQDKAGVVLLRVLRFGMGHEDCERREEAAYGTGGSGRYCPPCLAIFELRNLVDEAQ